MDEKISSLRYVPPVIDLSNKNDSHTLIVDLAGSQKRILEIGTSTGYISKIFKDHGNTVTGVEIDAEAGTLAQPFCERMIIGDIETLDLEASLGPASFDVIVCGDVLEHLKNPAATLKRLQKFLSPGGYFVVSIPNFCHGDVILNLLNGDFHYRPVGLLDETHIRFFGLKNIFTLFSDCGLQVSDLHTTVIEMGKTELRLNSDSKVPGDLFKFLRSLPDSNVYQYVFTAHPSANIEIPPSENIDFDALFSGALDETTKKIQSPLLQEMADKDRLLDERDRKVRSLEDEILNQKSQIEISSAKIGDLEQRYAVSEEQREKAEHKYSLAEEQREFAERNYSLAEEQREIAERKYSLAEEQREKADLKFAILSKQAEGLKSELSTSENQRRELEERLDDLEQKLTAIEKSSIWQLTMKFHTRIVEPLFPQQSRRRKIYDLGLKSGRIVINEGFGTLIAEFKKRRTGNPPATNPISAGRSQADPPVTAQDTGPQKPLGPGTLFEAFNEANKKSPYFVPLSDTPVSAVPGDIRFVAFYLPQFHPIPENDQWWGKGFTEWTNVTKAIPQFKGHYQPHLPGELGYYDLRLPQIQKRQVELARQYGLSGFCFYYYWFKGKRLLEMPLNRYLSDTDLDFPFCICWANENWTRRWDGLEKEILIAQEHTPESDIEFIRDIDPILRDPRYIRIDGKPVLIIYQTALLPEPGQTLLRWREHCRNSGIGEIYLVAALTFGAGDPTEYGFDAAMEFPPHSMQNSPVITRTKTILNPRFSGGIYDYQKFVREKKYLFNPQFKLFKTVAPGWDNTARRENNASIFAGANPRYYKEWLLDVSRMTRLVHPPGEQFVFINAWNEWAEGTHLEPDQKFGYGYLQATSEVLLETRICREPQKAVVCPEPGDVKKNVRTAVVIHLYYLDLLEEITGFLRKIPIPFDLYVSCKMGSGQEVRKKLEDAFPEKTILVRDVENRGFDIAPFLIEFRDRLLSYDYVCKLHGKKSSHWDNPNIWRRYLFNNLVGDPGNVLEIISEFDRNPSLGIVFPENFPGLDKWLGWGANYAIAGPLLEKYGIRWPEDQYIDFPAGSMFWFRPKALKPLFDSGFTYEQFGSLQQTDGTLAHAIERIILLITRKEGYTWKKVLFFREKSTVLPDTPRSIVRDTGRIAVVMHLFYMDLLDEFVFFLKNIPSRFDMFISVPAGYREMTARVMEQHFPDSVCRITEIENIGYDIYPFICEFGPFLSNYDLVLKIHGKKSDYNPSLSGWRQYLLKELLGSQHRVLTILKEFRENPKLGLLYPEYYPPVQNNIEWGSNFTIAQDLLEDQDIVLDSNKVPDFPAGSMFWFRPAALSILFILPVKKEDFGSFRNQVDGTLAHAIERIIGIVVEKNNYTGKKFK